jgi:hypothetical protein
MATTKSDETQQSPMPWWWRRRVGMTPFYAGLLAGLLSLSSWLVTPAQAVVITIMICGVAMFAAHTHWSKKKDRGMRNLVCAVAVFFAVFVLLVRFAVLDWGWTLVMLLGGVFGLGAFWWLDNWNIRRVKIERDVERWPVLAAKLQMPQVRRGPMKETETGRRWHFWWDEGDFTLSRFKSNKEALESALHIPEGRLRFEHIFVKPGMKNPNAIIVTENTESPILDAPVPFDAPTMAKFTDPMLIGSREDGSQHKVTWFTEDFGGMHTLAAGSTGSGKSGLYNLVLAESAYCPDLVRWGIDAKGGMALKPWSPMFDWMVTDVEGEAFWMLNALHKVLLARSKYAADMGWGCWEPDADHPILLLVIDEAAEIFGLDQFDMNSLASSIARMGRAAGVLLLIATQYPTNEAIGSSQLMKNVRRRFCFAVEDGLAQRVVIPKSLDRFDASEIPIGPDFVGTYYSSEGGQISDLSGRVRYVTQIDVYRLVCEVSAEGSPVAVPGLDKVSHDAAVAGAYDEDSGRNYYRERTIYTVADLKKPKGWIDEPEVGAPTLTVIKGGAAEPVHGAPAAPAHDPVDEPVYTPPVVARRRPDEPVQAAADDEPIPWDDEKDPTMNLSELEPQTDADRATLAAALEQYMAQFDESTVSPQRAQELLEGLLDAAGPEGITIEDMRRVLPRSQSWYSDQLRARLFSTPPTAAKVGVGRYLRPAKLRAVKADA